MSKESLKEGSEGDVIKECAQKSVEDFKSSSWFERLSVKIGDIVKSIMLSQELMREANHKISSLQVENDNLQNKILDLVEKLSYCNGQLSTFEKRLDDLVVRRVNDEFDKRFQAMEDDAQKNFKAMMRLAVIDELDRRKQ